SMAMTEARGNLCGSFSGVATEHYVAKLQLRQADIELTVYRSEDAVEVGRCHRRILAKNLPRPSDDGASRGCDLAPDRRWMIAEFRAKLIERSFLGKVESQERSLF